MSEAPELERELAHDLQTLSERFADERFSTELRRALASRRWSRADDDTGVASLSRGRAEEVVNALRERFGHEPLPLAQSGDEGQVSDTVPSELDRLGWRSRPLDTGAHDASHEEREREAPPPEAGGRRVGGDEPDRSLREAHEEADRRRARRL